MSLSGTEKSDSGAQGPLIRLRRRGLPFHWCQWFFFLFCFVCNWAIVFSGVCSVCLRFRLLCVSFLLTFFFSWEAATERRISAFIGFRGLVPISYPISAQVLLIFTEDVGSLFNRSRLSGVLHQRKTTGLERRRNAVPDLQTGRMDRKFWIAYMASFDKNINGWLQTGPITYACSVLLVILLCACCLSLAHGLALSLTPHPKSWALPLGYVCVSTH